LTLIFLIAAKNQGPNQKRRTGASDPHSAGMPGTVSGVSDSYEWNPQPVDPALRPV